MSSDQTAKISIIMLARNQARFLPTSIGSIIENENIELVIIEPGSTDRTREIVDSFGSMFPDLIQKNYEKDSGPAEGLNHGLGVAKGEIIGFINGDDQLLPGAIQHVRKVFEDNPNLDLLLGSGFVIDQESGLTKFCLASQPSKYKLALPNAVTFFQQGMFFRRELANSVSFNVDNRISWDYEFLSDAVRAGATIKTSPRAIGIWRVHDNSLSKSQIAERSKFENKTRISRILTGRKLNILDQIASSAFRIVKFGRSLNRVVLMQFGRMKL